MIKIQSITKPKRGRGFGRLMVHGKKKLLQSGIYGVLHAKLKKQRSNNRCFFSFIFDFPIALKEADVLANLIQVEKYVKGLQMIISPRGFQPAAY